MQKYTNNQIFKLTSTQSLNELYKQIVETFSDFTDTSYGSIFISSSVENLRRAYTNIPVSKRIRSRKKGNTYKAFDKNKIIHIPYTELKLIHPATKEKNIHDILIIPLTNGTDKLGVVTLLSESQIRFSKDNHDLLKYIASITTNHLKTLLSLENIKQKLRERDIFISMASHELKTPLTSVSGYAQLSLNRLKKNKKIKARHIQGIVDQTQKLSNTITDFLNLENIHTGNLEYEFTEVSILDVIQPLVDEFKVNYPNHQLQVNYNFDQSKIDDIWIEGDFYKISRAISNILRNAGKYSPENSTVSISLSLDKSSVTISIQDQGPGINEDEIDKVFNLFYRSKSMSEHGKGIGLFLAKKIIHKHQGSINIEQNPPQGAKFNITLPTIS